MRNMFREAEGLITLNLTGWNTSSVTDMNGMFLGASNLENLYGLSDWDTSSVTTMAGPFTGATSLSSLTLGTNFIIPTASNPSLPAVPMVA